MRCIRIGLLGLVGTLAACTSGGSVPPGVAPSAGSPSTSGSVIDSPSGSSTSTPPSADDWPTYHGDAQRSGVSNQPALRPPLQTAWTKQLDGAVYAQPILAKGLVVVATENNTVYALRPGGAIGWRSHLAPPVPGSDLPCGNIDPLGITGTPAYDAGRGLVFVVTETAGGRHDLRALDVRTGRQRWVRNLDVVDRDRSAEQQRGAVLVAHGRVYVAFGGLYGDCGNYIGYVASVTTDGTGPVLHYEVPSGREAGIWAPPGPVVDPRSGDLLVAVGNGSGTGGEFDGSDSVLRLSPSLRRVALFAPSTWPEDNAADLDLGSMSPVPVTGHVVIAGKRGTVYLLSPDLGGVGGQMATLDGCAAYGGAATTGDAVVLPCSDGIRRLDVAGASMQWRWHQPDVAGSPLIAGDTVYAMSQSDGDLYAVDLHTGAVRTHVHVGEVTRFATPAPVGGMLVVGTTSGVVAVAGR
ncbi:MAG TPA: PQQ-binding-like beta-propeller repeat protein [Mycobacteriales bacterium]|nr:PQQ-binding-like beta-propeller repeat protein [Mycobacteriales bacterium]